MNEAALLQLQVFYEIAMAIGGSLDLDEMLRSSLSTYLRKLNCSAGAVLWRREGAGGTLVLETVASIPRMIDRNPAYRAAMEVVSEAAGDGAWEDLRASLPRVGSGGGQGTYHLLSLPGFGCLVLIQNGGRLDEGILRALGPLNHRLARACRECLQNQALQEAVADLRRENQVRQQAERALVEAQERFRTVLDSIATTVYVADMETYEILFMNRHMREVFGEDHVGKICYRAFRGEGQPCADCSNSRLLDKAGNPTGTFTWEGKNPITGRWFLNHDRAILWSDGRWVRLQVATDITRLKEYEAERLKTQQTLQRAQRLESIATLAGGVAHQFNNALMVVFGTLDLLQSRPGLEADEATDVLAMKEAAGRMAGLTSQLLAYARGGTDRLETLSVAGLAQETLQSLRHTLASSLRVASALPGDTWPVEGDRAQLQMMLGQLITNAAESIGDGGSVTVRCKNVVVPAGKQDAGPPPGRYVRVVVRDDGEGMTPETLERLCEPFFTTRFTGRGLGMAAVSGVIENHGGYLDVQSQRGVGTTASVYLPAAEVSAAAPAPGQWSAGRGQGNILLVEDDAAVAVVMAAQLDALGYRAVLARTGGEAIELARDSSLEFDLAVLDVMLPDMLGGEVFRHLVEARRGIRVVVCSGYSEDGPAQEMLEAGADAFLQKPFELAALAALLGELLPQAAGPCEG